MTENGGSKERKIKGGPAMTNQVRDGWKELKHKYLQIESAIKVNFLSSNFSEEPSARCSCFLEIMYSHSL
jgi:hypothetical protein